MAAVLAQFISDKSGANSIDDGTTATLLANLATAIATVSKRPAGIVEYFAGSSAPAGSIIADGTALSRSTYAELFSAIGVTYGTGDGSTTFNLPDLRGEFIRGLDNGRGLDVGRALGTEQSHSLQRHNHYLPTETSTTGTAWGIRDAGWIQCSVNPEPISGYDATTYPDSRYERATDTGTQGVFSGETRPRNVALLACITY